MSLPERLCRRRSVGLALTTLGLLVAVSSGGARPQQPAFVFQAPPQSARGDFDGDGRLDTALVQDGSGTRRVSIQLSSSSTSIQLEAAVLGVVQSDIDDDGDLDLVATTIDGDLIVWLNDGHGHFDRKPRTNGRGLSGEPGITQGTASEKGAIAFQTLALADPSRRQTGTVVTLARPPTTNSRMDARCSTLPLLRAPPADLI
jgi:hypothetical protein